MTEINSSDPAVARKRRKAIIDSQRTDLEASSVASGESSQADEQNKAKAETGEETKEQAPTEKNSPPTKKRKAPVAAKPKDPAPNRAESTSGTDSDTGKGGKGKKSQIRYDPDVPMSKEQLAAWRREARRVRNRESAAASRARIRDRISELEEEVGEWKSKYSDAMERLERLEKGET